jgi:endonuclease G
MPNVKLSLLALAIAAICPVAGAVLTPVANENLTLGNPSNATADAGKTPDNFLVERPQFVLSYNNSKKIPNWVSWHLSPKWLGDSGRVGVFHPDEELPGGFNVVAPADYSHTGFDKGHMCPSGDRTVTKEDNDAVFTMIDMVPQSPDNNRKTWEHLESYCRTLVSQDKDLYIICGPAGMGGTGSSGFRNTISSVRKITVPSSTWKVVMVLPRGGGLGDVNKRTRTIAVIVPNQQGIDPDWKQFRHSVREVEELTGLDFFSNVPKAIQDAIEVTIDGSEEDDAPADGGDGQ